MILILGIIGAFGYTYWFLAPARTDDPLYYVPTLGIRWALVLPVLAGVLALFFVAIWIGWTMAITPPATLKERDKPNS